MKSAELRKILCGKASSLVADIEHLAKPWATEIASNCERHKGDKPAFPKTFTDPVHGPIDLYGWEVAFLDSQLLQRLRGVHQLGMAHLVYPSATHDRLSHTIGVLDVADRMVDALKRNAEHRKHFGVSSDAQVPLPTDDDLHTIRLAALLHDVGHAVFSHASEAVVEKLHEQEFADLASLLVDSFEGAKKPNVSEIVAILVIMSEPMRAVFEHPQLQIPSSTIQRSEFPIAIAARILGARSHVTATYCASVISGSIDADKLDYMARDSYFSGLPVGLDIRRLISKLEIISQHASSIRDPLLKNAVQQMPDQRYYQIGISLAGLTAYEQMIIGRVLLYDRVYYHHKVRSAEALVRKLFATSTQERGGALKLSEIYADFTDDSILRFLAGEMSFNGMKAHPAPRSLELSKVIRSRRLYHRAFAFAYRFVAIPPGVEDTTPGRTAKAALWNKFTAYVTKSPTEIEVKLYSLTVALIKTIKEWNHLEAHFTRDAILVDLPPEKSTTAGQKLMMRTEDGGITEANLLFEPEKWSDAYRNQKHCGYVFTPTDFVLPVALATQIFLYEEYAVVMRKEVQHLCKIEHLLRPKSGEWLKQARKAGLCSERCVDALAKGHSIYTVIQAGDIPVPEEWLTVDASLRERLAADFQAASPTGYLPSTIELIFKGLRDLLPILQMFEERAIFSKNDSPPDEKREMQAELMKALLARNAEACEGTELSGGESDVILYNCLVVENKVAKSAVDPRTLKRDAEWQCRRYAMPNNQTCGFVVVAYKPRNETDILDKSRSISITPLKGTSEGMVCVRLLVPWGHGVPSDAKAPKTA